MIVYDADRRPVTLEAELARGGEALVYRVKGRSDVVAKVYHQARPGYDHKLLWMRGNPPADPSRGTGHAAIAWPRDLLRDVNGRFIGFTMPLVAGAVPLLDVLSPRVRAQVLPAFDRRYLHRTARNLALAVAALHARGYVVGDVNQSNVLVTPSALVTLIDTDSFQVQEARPAQIVFYPCPVGKPEYTPPELQGQPFAGVVRQVEHDRFGLAVLIFQLLMEGSHPFRGMWRGAGDPPMLEEKIARGLYPYAVPHAAEVGPAPGTQGLDTLHPALAALFDDAFRLGHDNPRRRPAADAWAEALTAAETALVTCRSGHVHADHLPRCPICGAKQDRPVKRAAPARPSAPAATPRPVPRPSVAAAATGTAVAQRPALVPAVGAAMLWPWRAFGRAVDDTVTGGLRLLRSVLVGTVLFAAQKLFIRAGAMPARKVSLLPPATLPVARRTGALAVVAALLGAATAFLLAGAWLMVGAQPLIGPAASYGWVALAGGGTALALAALFRGLGDAVETGLGRRVVARAGGRALAATVGWFAGWFTGAVILAVLPGITLPQAVLGQAGSSGQLDLAAWCVGWVLFGAVGGALGAPVSAARGRWVWLGMAFGLLGWLTLSVVGRLV
jgi:hypothetical protein